MNKKFFFIIDDYGYKRNVDKKLNYLITQARIEKISLLSNFLYKRKVNKLFFSTKKMKFAAHINLTEGKSLTGYRLKILPFFVFRLFLGLERLDDIKKEIEEQLLFLIKKGFKVSELNSHQHIHAISPISEIFKEIATRYKINEIRAYGNIEAITLKGKISLLILKLVAFLSYLFFYKKIGLPYAWQIRNVYPTIFLSWDGANFSLIRLKKKYFYVNLVIHPFLGYDGNEEYLKFFINNEKNKNLIT